MLTVRVGVYPMFGKHFASMYTGSMVGAGSPVFAVWGYVVANMKPDVKVGAQVELNPKLLGFIIGEPQAVIEKALAVLCAPDPNSRSKAEEGRRLVKIGTFDYKVVNGPKYLAIRDEEARRDANREYKRKERAKHKGPTATEIKQVREVEDGIRTMDQLGSVCV